MHLKLGKKLNFNQADKWYTHKLDENEIDKIHWTFEIQTEHQIPARIQDFSRFCYFSGPRNENKRKDKDKQILGRLVWLDFMAYQSL